ncbi:MAG TPA: hypothetical protein VGA24_09195 [Steroidobacteraceae bacterium]
MDQAAFHDELHPLDNLDVGERIARDGDDVGETFRCFPEARFVHVLRDRRDVACSLRAPPARRHRELAPVLGRPAVSHGSL